MSLALVAPASAFVFVFADIQKDKDVTVVENITITKTATITVTVTSEPEGAAEAIALANQENLGGTVSGYLGPGEEPPQQGPPGVDNTRAALIEDSIGTSIDDFNTGIVGVNQDAGNMNNQGNNVALAVTDLPTAFVNAEASASQINGASIDDLNAGNLVETDEDGANGPQKTDTIDNSINNNYGIVGVNQSVGNMNNQLNQVSLAAGLGDAPVALSEADLGQYNAANIALEIGTYRTDTITDSVLSHQGIVGVNQSAGNMDNQANNVSVAAIAGN
jgi:hypothetical protein